MDAADPHLLPVAEFAFPGPLRDALVAAILSGAKTSTSALLEEYLHDAQALPRAGDRSAVIDSVGRRVAVIETTHVDVVRLGVVPLRHAVDEGEGFVSVAEWRTAHLAFWRSAEFTAALPGVRVDDDTRVVLERFTVVERAGRGRTADAHDAPTHPG